MTNPGDACRRKVTYLRVSVTDRCDFRCRYCMKDDVQFVDHDEILRTDEIATLCAAFIRNGVDKLRVTGGEPLVRRGVMSLFEKLSAHIGNGLNELTLTTNGSQLARYAEGLAAVGVRRVNVSLDTLDPERFASITRTGRLDRVLDGIGAAVRAGLRVKINTVVMGGVNDGDLDTLIRWCGAAGHDLTLIETMPFGAFWDPARFLSMADVRRDLAKRWTVEPLDYSSGGPARYHRVAETGTRLGFITPLTDHFCDRCNRVRLSALGRLHPCLGEENSVDLRGPLRAGISGGELDALVRDTLAIKPKGHNWAAAVPDRASRTMNLTGG